MKFRQASNYWKRVLEAAKLAYANKAKESVTCQKLGFHDFSQIANSVLSKVKSAAPPFFNGLKVFVKNFSKNSSLDESGMSLPAFPSRTNLKLHNISLTP